MSGRLEGRVGVVTGAARGQGRSHALAMAREGASVVACDIADDIDTVPYGLATEADLEETVRQVQSLGGRCVSVVADVRSGKEMSAVAAAAMHAFLMQ